MSTDTKFEEQIAELARGLAHEIKNPLSTLSMNLQLLKETWADAKTPREQRTAEKIALLQSETNRLKEIVDDFLRFARPAEATYSKQNLINILEEVLDFLAPTLAQNHVRLLKNFAEPQVYAMVDRDLMKQVYMNLLLNAVEAMPDGGDLLVRAATGPEGAQVDIADTGSGVEPDRIERLFDVYYSTKKGGSGLGLPTARKIVAAHGGRIEVHSDTTKGTNFRITIPAVE